MTSQLSQALGPSQVRRSAAHDGGKVRIGDQLSRHELHIYIWVVVKIMAPFLGALNNRCRIIIGTEKGTLILTTTHIYIYIHTYTFFVSTISRSGP